MSPALALYAVDLGDSDKFTGADPSILPSELMSKLSKAEQTRGNEMGSAARRAQWVAARRCELQLREHFAGGEFFRSFSHTDEWAVGVGVLGVRGVGVDLERAARHIAPGVERKILSPAEKPLFENGALSLLQFWGIKEACFKAHPDNEGLVVTQFEVLECRGAERDEDLIEVRCKGPQVALDFRACVFEHAGLQWVFALGLPTGRLPW